MRIHHLNCGTMCPLGGCLMYGDDRGRDLHHLVCHCLLVETPADGLMLVDTGLGLRDIHAPRPRLSGFFLAMNRLRLREDETAVRQIERLGFNPADVRHIVLTHLDFDHAGGLEDFPRATVHLLGLELEAARLKRDAFIARRRYRPRQWNQDIHWESYVPGGETWFGFSAVRDLRGLPPEILIVPLAGHTWGHSGVAIAQADRWLLHAGDAYFHRLEMDVAKPQCPPGLRAYQRMMEVDRAARLGNQERLRSLKRDNGERLDIFCAHDPAELAQRRLSVEAAAYPSQV